MSSTFAPRASEEKALVTIRGVETRTVNKRDGTSFTMYDIYVVEQEKPFNTTKRAVAESAFDLKGQAAEMAYSVKQNGDFTNYWANSILPAATGAAVAALRAQEAQPILRAAADLPEPSPAPAGPSEKDQAIHRQVAAKVAASLHAAAPGSAEDFWDNCLKLAAYFDSGVTPTQAGYSEDDDGIPF
jgi:hypothetical protein